MPPPPEPHPPEPPRRVLAAIVNFGALGVGLTARAAASVLEQSDATDLSVAIFDNGSDDATMTALREAVDKRVEIRPIPVNRGYGAAANEAIRVAAARQIDLVWVLNNDLVVEPGALVALLSALRADDTLAAVAPVTIGEGTPAVVLGAGVNLSLGRARARHRHEGDLETSLASGVEYVPAIEAAAVLIRVAPTLTIGVFDERFFMYWEDTEWSVRAWRAGWRLGVVLDARVRHLVARSSAPPDRAELMIANRVRFARTVLGPTGNLLFAAYLTLWLPAYTAARLVPAFGLRRSLHIARNAVVSNVRDAAHHGGWLIRRPPGDSHGRGPVSPT